MPLCSLPAREWNEPVHSTLREKAVTALEKGNILFFPDLSFALSDEEKLLL